MNLDTSTSKNPPKLNFEIEENNNSDDVADKTNMDLLDEVMVFEEEGDTEHKQLDSPNSNSAIEVKNSFDDVTETSSPLQKKKVIIGRKAKGWKENASPKVKKIRKTMKPKPAQEVND